MDKVKENVQKLVTLAKTVKREQVIEQLRAHKQQLYAAGAVLAAIVLAVLFIGGGQEVPPVAAYLAEGGAKAAADVHVHLIGGGIASLASAVFLVQNTPIPGSAITIYDENDFIGGAMDAFEGKHLAKLGIPYVMRGGRMFEDEVFKCTYALMRAVPCEPKSTNTPSDCKNLFDDYEAFNKEDPYSCKTRLMNENGEKIDASKMNFSMADRIAMVKIMLTPESWLGEKTIADVFPEHFFQTNFWYMWATIFSFEPWHSAVEMRRYMKRFVHRMDTMDSMSTIKRTRYAQQFSLVEPIMAMLRKNGVKVVLNTRINDIDFASVGAPNQPAFSGSQFGASKLYVEDLLTHTHREVAVNPIRDLVFATVGSIPSDHSFATHSKPAQLDVSLTSGAFRLWHRIADKVNDNRFGNPKVFTSKVAQTKWLSYTCTCRDAPTLRRAFEPIGNGLITITSPWLLTFVHKHPSYPKLMGTNTTLIFGYGLFADVPGKYVKKTMQEVNGAELWSEIMQLTHWDQTFPSLAKSTECSLSLMPFVTSQFMPRLLADRPRCVPAGSTNFALLGQFIELDEDQVFTVEYSVHAAMEAVSRLAAPKLAKAIPPIYHGDREIGVLLRAARVMMT